MPAGIYLKPLDAAANTNLIYQYTSLTFHVLPDCLAMGNVLKSVRMKGQAENVYTYRRNNFGIQGVKSPFTWPLTHFAHFPHIICQQMEIINDQQFRKNKSRELEHSAQLKLGNRGRELAEHLQNSLLELEKELNTADTQIVKLDYNILVWHPNKDILQHRVDKIKSSFAN